MQRPIPPPLHGNAPPAHLSHPRFRGRLHDPRTATVLGRWLGLLVLLCFGTGLFSHLLQEPPTFLIDDLPTRPVWGYRLTQGLHVASGTAAIPVLLAKLWTVYPRLFVWPPVRGLRHALERLSVAVLVAAGLLEVFLGLLNTVQWYPWPYSFRTVHWALAWLLMGALLLHLAVQAPTIAAHWRSRSSGTRQLAARDEPDRRALLRSVTAAVGAVTAVSAGQSLPPLRDLTLLAPRHPDHGTQGLPVNRTAAQAAISPAAVRSWRLRVTGPRTYELTRAELARLPQHRARLPIACVEGWSKAADWEGVRLRDLLEHAGAPPGARIRVVSLQRRGGYGVSELGGSYARDPLTLLALRLNGQELSADHGYPARIIAPNRPGALQTKWVSHIEVLS